MYWFEVDKGSAVCSIGLLTCSIEKEARTSTSSSSGTAKYTFFMSCFQPPQSEEEFSRPRCSGIINQDKTECLHLHSENKEGNTPSPTSSGPTTNLLRTFSAAYRAACLPGHVQCALASSIWVGAIPCIGRLVRHGVVESRDIIGK